MGYHFQSRTGPKWFNNHALNISRLINVERLIFSKIYCMYPINSLKELLHYWQMKNRKIVWAKRAVLRTYFENQAMLEPILLYRTSKYKQTKRPGYKTVCELPFCLLMWIILGLFLSSAKIQTCQHQTLLKK